MRCLYEVLQLERDADDATIKLAYRKGALKWHPDKNQDNLAEAEERFKELQNAYEVLSDKHERAWYDAHRSDILRQGASHQAGGGTQGYAQGQPPEDDVNLFPYFSSTCYSGYTDDLTGFYGVYDEVFSRLAKAEDDAHAEAGAKAGQEEAPRFGSARAPWSQVADFYSYWLNFATAKAFAWADQYNPAAAPNRKVRRLMEAENQKVRKAKRREFNDTVRELAAFVRKRDKRVLAHQAEEAQKQIEREAEEQSRRTAERAERRIRAREFEEAAWAEAEATAAAAAEDEAASPADVAPDGLFCVACDKSFRSENALANHERSKKHLEKVAVMREMLEEEEGLGSDAEESETPADASCDGRGPPNGGPPDSLSSVPGSEVENDSSDGGGSAREGSARASKATAESDPSDSGPRSSEDEDAMLDALLRMQAGQSGRGPRDGRKAGKQPSESGNRLRDRGPAADMATVGEPPSPAGKSASPPADVVAQDLAAASLDDDRPGAVPDPGQKKPRRRAKQKAGSLPATAPPLPVQPAVSRRRSAAEKTAPGRSDDGHVCSVCGAEFASRTKLFQHIKQKGHAALK